MEAFRGSTYTKKTLQNRAWYLLKRSVFRRFRKKSAKSVKYAELFPGVSSPLGDSVNFLPTANPHTPHGNEQLFATTGFSDTTTRKHSSYYDIICLASSKLW